MITKKASLQLYVILFTIASCHFMTSTSITTSLYAQSPYISKVFEYCPAPGQYINKMPEYKAGESYEDILLKVNECITGDTKRLVSLGGYGGYVVFGFDHLVENKQGKYDFKIWGNAIYTVSGEKIGGNCEPGIVLVAKDINNNGLPDDTWYELAGSEFHSSKTIKNYQITYYKPDENKAKTPSLVDPTLNDTSYIKWKSNQYDSGYISRNNFNSQSYYPLWLNTDSITYIGTKLADNYIDESGNNSYYVQYALDWGYADNHPNSNDLAGFDISWATDKDGNYVELDGINFVKVYTGINQYCGWLGETSTEIIGAEDFHLQGIDIDVPEHMDIVETATSGTVSYSDGLIYFSGFAAEYNCTIVSITGQVLSSFKIESEEYIHNVELPCGVYILELKGLHLNRAVFQLVVTS